MYFVPHFGRAKVYETSIMTPCFQILAKTLHAGARGLVLMSVPGCSGEGCGEARSASHDGVIPALLSQQGVLFPDNRLRIVCHHRNTGNLMSWSAPGRLVPDGDDI